MTPTKPTDAELECLALVAEAKTSEEIGRIRGTSPETARTQIQQAMMRLHTSTRAGAVAICIREGWIT
jgi:DNA-binding CsgD family transcriptional regulator